MAVANVTIVSGPAGAGKTTVCLELCSRFERAVHLDTDWFFGAIKAGYILPWDPLSKEQNDAVVRAAARSIGPYVEAGYEVFVDGFIRAWAMEVYRTELASVVDRLHFVLLLPDAEECMKRGVARTDHAIVPIPLYHEFHAQFAADGFETHRVDSSLFDAKRTADLILRERAAERYSLSTR